MPTATACPCEKWKPLHFSIAWPSVWPRLSSCRLPRSSSSAATSAALWATHRSITHSASAAHPPRESRENSSVSPSTPYLTASAAPSESVAAGKVASASGSISTSRG